MTNQSTPKPYNEGMLQVSDNPRHTMHYQQYGNPDGIPVFFCHGGPGVGTSPSNTDFFDLTKYRVILFDQRGCGKSTYDEGKQLEANTTQDLVNDMEKLREKIGLKDKKIHLFGGSWGSTLALAYSIAHPDSVKSLTVRGIFLGRKHDNDYCFQGDAADMGNPNMPAGTYQKYRKEWREFVEFIPEDERGDMMAAYKKRMTDPNEEVRMAALKHWWEWESITCFLDKPNSVAFDEDPKTALDTAKLEIHYYGNKPHSCFLPTENYILKNADKLAKIPTINIVNGRFDEVCPVNQADDLFDALKAQGRNEHNGLTYKITTAGHVASEPATNAVLKAWMARIAKREELGLGEGRALAS